jgi:hypothetical protein
MRPVGIDPTRKSWPRSGWFRDKLFGYIAAHCLFPLRSRIHLRSGGTVLVPRGDRAAADADGRRGLPVPRLPAQRGGAGERNRTAIAFAFMACDKRRASLQHRDSGDRVRRSSASEGGGNPSTPMERIASLALAMTLRTRPAFSRPVGAVIEHDLFGKPVSTFPDHALVLMKAVARPFLRRARIGLR